MEVIDNFLSEYYFKSIRDQVLSPDFPWYFNDHIVSLKNRGKGEFQFTHTLMTAEGVSPSPDQEIHSNYYSVFIPVLQKLEAKKSFRIKANLLSRTFFHRKSGYHRDIPRIGEHQTAIYYLNTNNGWTEFKKGGKVKSVANRIVIFDSDLEHRGVTCTDEQRRVVINFNYV